MPLAPVALFVYNRLRHTQNTLASLLANSLAKESTLFIYSDAPKDGRDEEAVISLRKYLKGVSGFRQVNIIEEKDNLGPAASIIRGVTRTIEDFGRVIVVEDDLALSGHFLKFMNDGLDFYRDEEKVMSICGYMYPVDTALPETLFLRMPDTWGWATWKRGWDLFEPDGAKLLEELKAKKLLRSFDMDGTAGYVKMLKQQIEGKRDSWGIRWVASAIISGRFSLYPGKSMVRNAGFDMSGRHCGFLDGYSGELSAEPASVSYIPLEENKQAMGAIKVFNRRRKLRSLIGILSGR